MNNYHVIVSGRVIKDYEIEADCREDAVVEALEFFNEFASVDYTDCNSISEVFIDAVEIPNDETKDENTTEE